MEREEGELCVVEFSPRQGALHVEPLSWWMERQVAALLRDGRARGDGSWVVIGVVPRGQAAAYGESFRRRFSERFGERADARARARSGERLRSP